MRLVKQNIFLFLLISFVVAKSQSSYVAGVFPTIDHSGALTSKIEYGIYYFAAFPLINLKKADLKKDPYFNLLYLEQAITYKLTDKLSLTGSYLYQRANVVYDNYVNENRFYIQAKYKHTIKKVNLTHRFRFDGRFIHNNYTDKSPFTHRVRYLLGIDTPLNETLYFTAYEEAFFNTFKNAGVTYGENWAYAALGKKLNAHNKIEAGILYITWNTGVHSWFNQYYLQLTWINHLNFTKTNK